MQAFLINIVCLVLEVVLGVRERGDDCGRSQEVL